MKKRKIKLFASVASLAMVVAVMGVGVWAATAQAVKVSTQINFQASSVAATVKLKVSDAGTDDKTKALSAAWLAQNGASTSLETLTAPTGDAEAVNNLKENSLPLHTFKNEDDSATKNFSAFVHFEDLDGDGFIMPGTAVSLVYNIELSTDGADNIVYGIKTATGTTPNTIKATPVAGGDTTEVAVSELFTVTIADSIDTSATATGTSPALTLTNKDGTAWKATDHDSRTITVTYTLKDTYKLAYTFTGINLGDVTLYLANNATNLDKMMGA